MGPFTSENGADSTDDLLPRLRVEVRSIEYCVSLLAALHLLQINSVLEYHPLGHRCLPNFETLIRHKHRGETVLVPLRTVVVRTV